MNYKALYQNLADDSDITDIVSTRIYHDAPPKDPTAPYIVFRKITGSQINAVNYATERWSVRLIGSIRKANASATLNTLKEAVIANLNQIRGTMGSGGNTQVIKQSEFALENEILLRDHNQKQIDLDFIFHFVR